MAGTKLSSAFLSALLPLAHAGQPGFVRSWDGAWEAAETASLACLFLLSLRPSLAAAAAVRRTALALTLVSLALVAAPPVPLVQSALPLLFLSCHACLFLQAAHASSLALRSGRPLARARLLATVAAQLLQVLFLLLPSLAAAPLLLFCLALAGPLMAATGAGDAGPEEEEEKEAEKKTPAPINDKGKEELDDPLPPAAPPEQKKKPEAVRVSLAAAAAFVLVAAVGLNGEQILDASFKVARPSSRFFFS